MTLVQFAPIAPPPFDLILPANRPLNLPVHDLDTPLGSPTLKLGEKKIPIPHVLVGIITHDDALDIVTQEHSEDTEKFMAIAGRHQATGYLRSSA